MSLRLIELLDYVEDHYRPRRLILISGYRSPEFNNALRANGRRVAQASMHTEGMAADVQPVGLDRRRLWNQLRREQLGGVGLYQSEGFVHLDTGKPRFWEASTSKVEQNLAKENARLFARTDFDRYDRSTARSSVCIRSRRCRSPSLAGDGRRHDDRARTAQCRVRRDGDRWIFAEPADRYELR
jgi:hypothetical protein